ncbi:MAG: type VI secretion system ImpA family N-terminal domain-containing protein, partial [Pseudomonadota bacterium]|nr:type VI secretion system ImpA family N-terminal domain-containing protein [Pseudomonadota bacterium]
MPDVAPGVLALSPFVGLWLSPLDDAAPSGPNLEYDPEFLELLQATGKPATQFGVAEPADWPRVKELAESLLGRTRDLRLALWWSRAMVNLEGFAAAPSALALLHGLLDRFWDTLHPLPDPDDPDALARLSVIGGLDKLDSLLGDVRGAPLSMDRQFAGLRARDVELALGKLAPRQDESPRTQGQITGLLASAPEATARLHAQADAGLAFL